MWTACRTLTENRRRPADRVVHAKRGRCTYERAKMVVNFGHAAAIAKAAKSTAKRSTMTLTGSPIPRTASRALAASGARYVRSTARRDGFGAAAIGLVGQPWKMLTANRTPRRKRGKRVALDHHHHASRAAVKMVRKSVGRVRQAAPDIPLRLKFAQIPYPFSWEKKRSPARARRRSNLRMKSVWLVVRLVIDRRGRRRSISANYVRSLRTLRTGTGLGVDTLMQSIACRTRRSPPISDRCSSPSSILAANFSRSV
jgi:hypothetical protein